MGSTRWIDQQQHSKKGLTMRRSGKGSGGGAGMNKVTQRPVRTGDRARAVSPKGVSQIGSSIGNHVSEAGGKTLRGGVERTQGAFKPAGGPGGIKQGNESSAELSGANCGPGKGRQVYASGVQGQHGASAPGNAPAKNVDILNQFGPNVPGRR
jgi:hypothetical protein